MLTFSNVSNLKHVLKRCDSAPLPPFPKSPELESVNGCGRHRSRLTRLPPRHCVSPPPPLTVAAANQRGVSRRCWPQLSERGAIALHHPSTVDANAREPVPARFGCRHTVVVGPTNSSGGATPAHLLLRPCVAQVRTPPLLR